MAVNYAAALKTTRMNAVLAAIDAGTPASKIEIGTAGFGATLVALNLPAPSGTVSGDTLTFDCTPALEGTATGTNTAAEARIKDGDGNIIVSGLTVGVGGSFNINLNTVSINTNDVVQITSGSIQHAA